MGRLAGNRHVSSPAEFNNAARNYISRGLNALNMVLDQATRDGHDPDWARPDEVGIGRAFRWPCWTTWTRALEGIDLEQTSLLVRCGASAMPFAALLVALARKRKKTPTPCAVASKWIPLGVLSHEGKLPQSLEGAYREMAALTRWAAEHAPHLQTICVHSRAWHEAGGQRRAGTCLRPGNRRRISAADAQARSGSGRWLRRGSASPLRVGVNFFMEIAKLRALRMLWARRRGSAGRQ